MKNFSFLDLFCGCGGLSLGFEQAGFNPIFGLDFDKPSLDTYEKNFGKNKTINGDIRDIKNGDISRKISEAGLSKIDVIVGGPPCQGFSFARKNGSSNDPRNFLFREFVRVVSSVEPLFFVMENVKGILSSDNGSVVKEILKRFNDVGYEVSYKVLNASDYGVPQIRERTFFVGNKIGIDFKFPEPTTRKNKLTVYDALSDLFSLEIFAKRGPLEYKCNPKSHYQEFLRENSYKVYNHEPTIHAKIVVERIKHVPQGGNWKDVPKHLFKNNRNNRHSSVYKRLKPNEPSVTIDTGNAHSNYFHPIYNRIPTVREAARLQSFPDRFIFLGTLSNQHRQVGNAVPPILAKVIATEIMKNIGKHERS